MREPRYHPIGWVYFVQAGGPAGPVKIGFTKLASPLERMLALQTQCPVKIEALGAVVGRHSLEQRLLDLFRPWLLWGEWFEAAPQVLGGIALLLRSRPQWIGTIPPTENLNASGRRRRGFCGRPYDGPRHDLAALSDAKIRSQIRDYVDNSMV